MEPRSFEARLVALESTDLGFAKMLDQLVACVGGLAAVVKTPDVPYDGTLEVVFDGLDDLRQSLARLSEFLGPKDG
jgi:hypothetical protein